MVDRFPGLRCRPGDLAVIVQDESECRANIGQIVRVIGEYTQFRGECRWYWLVEPQSSQPSAVLVGTPGSPGCKLIYDKAPRAHQDAWLRPLPEISEPDETTLITEQPMQSEWRDPMRQTRTARASISWLMKSSGALCVASRGPRPTLQQRLAG